MAELTPQLVTVQQRIRVGSNVDAVDVGDFSAGSATNSLFFDASTVVLTMNSTISNATFSITDPQSTITMRPGELSDSGVLTVSGNNLVVNAQTGFLEFSQAGTVRWQIDGNRHLRTAVDNTYDIGLVGGNRPRTVYVGTSVLVAAGGTISCPGTGADSERFGVGASTGAHLRALAIGVNAAVTGDNGTAVGWSASADTVSTAVGRSAAASGEGTALGYVSSATGGSASVAVGRSATATVVNSVSVGGFATASTAGGVAIGSGAAAAGSNAESVAVGANANADSGGAGGGPIAIGPSAAATAQSSMAIGRQSAASDVGAQAIGVTATASGSKSLAIGLSALAASTYTTCIGPESSAGNNGLNSTVVGGIASAENSFNIDVVDYTQGAGDTITITMTNGTVYTLTEGVGFTAATDNATTAQSILAAVDALSGIEAGGTPLFPSTRVSGNGRVATIVSGDPTAWTATLFVDDTNDTAVGYDAQASMESIAIGSGSRGRQQGVAIGYLAKAEITNNSVGGPIAIGYLANTIPDGRSSPPGTISIGRNARSRANGIAIGSSAVNNGTLGFQICIGNSSSTTGESVVVVGSSTTLSGTRSVAVGSGSSGTGPNQNMLGGGCVGGAHQRVILLGFGATATGSNQMVVGSPVAGNANNINDVYIGWGVETDQINGAGLGTVSINASSAITNVDQRAMDLEIRSGKSTGAATATTISFWTPTPLASGAAQQTLSKRWEVGAGGHLLPGSDNAYDIGSLSNQVRDIYVAGTIAGSGAGSFDFLNVGSTTAATATGDLAAGDGTREMAWDASTGNLSVGLPAGRRFEWFDNANAPFLVARQPTAGALNLSQFLLTSDVGDATLACTTSTYVPAAASGVDVPRAALFFSSLSNTGGMSLQCTANAPIRFATANTHRWNILGTGHLTAQSDNSLDIGASGATRPRTGYFGTALNVGNGVTPSTANGDLVAGDGTREMSFDASAGRISLTGTHDALNGITATNGSAGTSAGANITLGADVGSGTIAVTSSTYVNAGWKANALNLQSFSNLPGGIWVNSAGADTPIELATQGTARWRFLGAGSGSHLIPVADNAYDIGASGATRPRTGYFGTSVVAPAYSSSGALTLTSDTSSTITVDSGSTGAVNVGTGANAKTITIGNTTGATALVYDAGTGGHSFTGNMGFFGTAPVSQQTDIGALTDSTGGTADNTVAAVSGSGDDTTINNNFADLIDQINQLRTTLRNLGLMA